MTHDFWITNSLGVGRTLFGKGAPDGFSISQTLVPSGLIITRSNISYPSLADPDTAIYPNAALQNHLLESQNQAGVGGMLAASGQ